MVIREADLNRRRVKATRRAWNSRRMKKAPYLIVEVDLVDFANQIVVVTGVVTYFKPPRLSPNDLGVLR